MLKIGRRDLMIGAAACGFFGSKAYSAEANLAFVDPELRPMAADMMKASAGQPPLNAQTLAAQRVALGKIFTLPALPSPSFTKHLVRSYDGYMVPIYVVNARPGSDRPAILYTHGGGFVLGDAVGRICDVQALAAELDCVVVTVDYRLAPETTFKGSIEDNYAALRWLHSNAQDLGVDPARIAVMGGSAGGGHAALLALTARDRKEVKLAYQALIYPMLDDRTGVTHHPASPIGTLVWKEAENRFGWQSFLGQGPGTGSVPAQAVPARYKDLAGLPPTFIGVGSIDLFVDEDIAYAHRLVDAGVPTDLVVVPGAYHGFDIIGPNTRVGKYFNAAVLNALRRGLSIREST
ncbi:alpha/beta hydrolase [Sphingomonas mali]|uniref:alpha/beta hydrolase n=1 Tax=Sphingomonas mali TaxID=40682 RepID=UPI0008344486|nr:alpha/beta hydrolase [Sphingomonas mali]